MFDDFHGPIEFDNLAAEMKRVFPDREIVDFPNDHPVFSRFYRLDGYLQVPGLGSFMAGRMWEKGGYVAKLRTIFDNDGRPMLFINWNTDMGDGVEWSNVEEYPGCISYTSLVPDDDQRDRLRADALMTPELKLGLRPRRDWDCAGPTFRSGVWRPMDADSERERVAEGRDRILGELRKVIIGQDEVVEQVCSRCSPVAIASSPASPAWPKRS